MNRIDLSHSLFLLSHSQMYICTRVHGKLNPACSSFDMIRLAHEHDIEYWHHIPRTFRHIIIIIITMMMINYNWSRWESRIMFQIQLIKLKCKNASCPSFVNAYVCLCLACRLHNRQMNEWLTCWTLIANPNYSHHFTLLSSLLLCMLRLSSCSYSNRTRTNNKWKMGTT